jgi:hypothetical protein
MREGTWGIRLANRSELRRETRMTTYGTDRKQYALAVALGALGGGVIVAILTGALPRMLGKMRAHMAEYCSEHCACARRETAEGETPERKAAA